MSETDGLTLVVFRKWPDGQIDALLPEIAFDKYGLLCVVYSHQGQHSSADYTAVLNQTVAATPEEFKPLKKELEGLGYVLKVRQKVSSRVHAERRRYAMRRLCGH